MTCEKAEVPCFLLIVITKYSQKIHNSFVGGFYSGYH